MQCSKMLRFLAFLSFVACGDASLLSEPESVQRDALQHFTFPAKLHAGDTVSVVAPSSAVAPEVCEAALEAIRGLGLVPKHEADILASDLLFAGPEARRIREFKNALADPDSRAIWAIRGGYGASFLLPHLDTGAIREAGKWLIGFSDITVLHAAWSRAGVGSLHGAVGSYLDRWSEDARTELMSYLGQSGTHTLAGRAHGGQSAVEGHLAGGNLAMLASLVGTDYFPDWRGAIVLFEDVDEPPYRLERYLLQLLQAGAFEDVQGFAIGQLTDCESDDSMGVDAEERIVRFLLAKTALPIVSGLPIGHDPDSRSVLLGAPARLDPASATLTIQAP